MAQMESKGLTQPAGGGWVKPERRTRWVVTANTLSPLYSPIHRLSSLSASAEGAGQGLFSPQSCQKSLEPFKCQQPESAA